MSQISPVITEETNNVAVLGGFQCQPQHGAHFVWPGFRFSRIGSRPTPSFSHRFLLVLGLAMLGGFGVLCKVYFFSAPLTGIGISFACYVSSIVLSRALIVRS